MTSRKKIKIFDFNGGNVAKHWNVAGEIFAISDCLASNVLLCKLSIIIIATPTQVYSVNVLNHVVT